MNCEAYEWPSTCSSTSAAPAVAGSAASEGPAVGGEASAAPSPPIAGRWNRRHYPDPKGLPPGEWSQPTTAAGHRSGPPPGEWWPAPPFQPLLEQKVTMEVLRQLTPNQEWRGSFKQHNAALKWFRHKLLSHPTGPYQVMWFADEPVAVATMIHDAVGPEFHFDETWTRSWDWKEMLCQLDEESMRYVVEGPNSSSGGVTGCAFAVREKSYCHLMHHNARQAGKTIKNKTPEFDFVIFRSGGTAIRLHPDWNRGKFRCYNADPHATEVPIPQHGLGKSEGSGTVQRYKDMGVLRELRFDTAKGKEKDYPGKRPDPQ
jgi:hypothetical protein